MVFLLSCFDFLSEIVGCLNEIEKSAAAQGLQASSFCWWEIGGDEEHPEVGQGLADLFQRDFQIVRPWRDQRCAWANGSEGITHQILSVGLVGNPVGLNDGQGLPSQQSFPGEDLEEAVLIFVWQRSHRFGQRRPDLPPRDLGSRGLRELRPQGFPSHDPRGLSPELFGYGRRCQTILVDERADDPRFIHRRDRSWRSIRLKNEFLALCNGDRRFDDDRDFGSSRLFPAFESLEAIDDFEELLSGRNDS